MNSLQARQIVSTKGKQGKQEKGLEDQILSDLQARVPWNTIAQRYRVSTKRIQQIKERHEMKEVRTREGEFAAKVFELLGKGMKPHEIVIRLKAHPDEIMGLWDKYRVLTNHTNPLCEDCWHVAWTVAVRYKGILEYPCHVCGEKMLWDISKKDRRDFIMKLLVKGGIGAYIHADCLSKRS